MRESRFETRIITPQWAKEHPSWGDIPEMMEIYCTNIDLPGVSLIPEEYKPIGFGLLEKRPTGAIISEFTAIMMIDANTEVLKFFQDWINNTVVYDTANSPGNRFYSSVGYKKEYVTDIDIDIPDAKGGVGMTWTGHDCWPFSLGNISLGWESNDAIAKAVVVFQLRTWTSRTPGGDTSGRRRGYGGTTNILSPAGPTFYDDPDAINLRGLPGFGDPNDPVV